jgi:hypothetical protein
MQARRLSADPGWFGLYALPGFLGSMLIAVGALGVGWFPLSADILQWKFIDFVQTETVFIQSKVIEFYFFARFDD